MLVGGFEELKPEIEHARRSGEVGGLLLYSQAQDGLGPKLGTPGWAEAGPGPKPWSACYSKTSFLEHAPGIPRSPRSGVSGQQKSAKVRERCSKTSFLEHAPANPGQSPEWVS